ncbi:hypothetical protein DLJ47_28240 [Micromonospora sp. S4605]|uniref:hypothetical protein n=1 Tax=Micromonospora sp. S4605 TaxID=1420897 RepID=UPI000D6FDB9C|nr:hypothetical protein [Micromonospora sp. S4605]PWU48498.1 hypothetical protein DLJ47_28240 [Micromonospora sp. S4605]
MFLPARPIAVCSEETDALLAADSEADLDDRDGDATPPHMADGRTWPPQPSGIGQLLGSGLCLVRLGGNRTLER